MPTDAADAIDVTDATAELRALVALGEEARAAGDWQRAAEAQQTALAIAEALHGDTLTTAVVAQNLAVTFKYRGRFEDAGALLERALSIAEAAHDLRVAATVCHNLGGLAHARGEVAAGIRWARRAVELREPLDDPIALAGDRGALAGLLIERGRDLPHTVDAASEEAPEGALDAALDEAERLLHAARRVFVEAAGEDDLEVAVVDGNLAAIAIRRGALDLAELHARRALAIKEAVLGPESPALAVTLTTLGTIRRRRGATAEAAALHRRAIEVLRPAVTADHPLLRTAEANLARARAAPLENQDRRSTMTSTRPDTTDASSRRTRKAVVVASATAAAVTPLVVAMAGLDHVVLARLATNHNEVAAVDD